MKSEIKPIAQLQLKLFVYKHPNDSYTEIRIIEIIWCFVMTKVRSDTRKAWFLDNQQKQRQTKGHSGCSTHSYGDAGIQIRS